MRTVRSGVFCSAQARPAERSGEIPLWAGSVRRARAADAEGVAVRSPLLLRLAADQAAASALLGMEPEKKETLIESVRMRSFLYDCNDPNYKDTELKDAAWEEIGRELGILDGKAVKGEWKKIRDNFRDALKRQKGLRSGQTAIQIAQYKYYNQLSFLIPYMSNRSIGGGLDVDIKPEMNLSVGASDGEGGGGGGAVGTDGYPQNPAHQPQQPAVKKLRPDDRMIDFLNAQMKREERAEERQRKRAQLFAEYNHPLDHFFKTMCETTKLMPQRWQLYIKKEIFNIVCDAEEQILAASVSADLQTHQSPQAMALSPSGAI